MMSRNLFKPSVKSGDYHLLSTLEIDSCLIRFVWKVLFECQLYNHPVITPSPPIMSLRWPGSGNGALPLLKRPRHEGMSSTGLTGGTTTQLYHSSVHTVLSRHWLETNRREIPPIVSAWYDTPENSQYSISTNYILDNTLHSWLSTERHWMRDSFSSDNSK